ncbi:sugar porter family MFS transporter [Piscirickettsia litoralis]|uniref:MFS sugar transporter n=1 Tax=Piscirickettsia litoralis TaxID=1891921 RepID=A0ABX3ABU0_9GAMM|nr:sugar porter family MFS transporter [Piscirickettsia litoralis]ODN43589.1 MFS sugar transporter [Piscirickettsia litoralis]
MNTPAHAKSSSFSLFITFFAAIGGILYGYDIGIINGALLYIEHDINMSATETSLIVAAVLGGGALSTLVTGYLADRFGRKNMMITAVIIFLVGVAFLATANNYDLLLMGRVIQGIGVGIITIIIPLYLSEVAPKHLRGRGVCSFQVLLTAGILLANVIAYFFAKAGISWHMMFLSSGIPAVILGIGLLFLPKSPRWLVFKGNIKQARHSLEQVYSKESASQELDLICNSHKKSGSASIGALFQRKFIYPLMLVFGVAILNQLTGINTILQFSATILKGAGLHSDLSAISGSIWITVVNFIITIIAMLLVDKVGRKPLLSIGTAGVAIALVLSGFAFIYLPEGMTKGIIIGIGLHLYILFFAIGPGVVVWIVLSELLPNSIRSIGMAIALSLNSLASTVLASSFLPLVNHIGYGGIFIMCGLFTVIYFYLAYFKMPESKGKSLEEIESSYSENGPSLTAQQAST